METPPPATLKAKALGGGVATLAGQVGKALLQFLTLAVLARLVSPTDFGLVAMVTALFAVPAVLGDAGLLLAAVQRDRITSEQQSVLFWVNTAIGVGLTLVAAASAPLVEALYREPRVVAITVVLALTFLLSGLAVQHRAHLTRQMRFKALATMQLLSQLAGSLVAVALALLGAGYWALVAQLLVFQACLTAASWSVCPWRPGRPRRGLGVRPLLWFGLHTTGTRLALATFRALERALIGRFLGASTLGFYSRANSVMALPVSRLVQPANGVAVPTLSRLQTEPERFRRYYLAALSTLAGVGLPAVTVVLVCAASVVRVVLGPGWDETIPLVVALGPAAYVGVLDIASKWTFAPLGRTDREVRAVTVQSLLLVLAVAIGLRWGALGVAWAVSIGFAAIRPPFMAYACAGTPISLSDVGRALWRPALSCLPPAAALVAMRATWTAGASPVADLLLRVPIFFAGYVLAYALLPGGARTLRAAWRSVADLRSVVRRETDRS